MKRRQIRIAAVAVVVLAIAVAIYFVERARTQGHLTQEQIQRQFTQLTRVEYFDENEPQLWAHRGYHRGGAEENTIEAMQAAIARGFPGIELDMFWGPHLVVQHDRPTRQQIAKGDYITLDEFFAVKSPETYLYLDFKNLTAENAEVVSAELHPLLAQGDRLRRTFIESERWDALAALRRYIPDIRTLYLLRGYDDPIAVQAAVVKSGTRAVSIRNTLITDAFVRDFAYLRIHTYTVNRAKEIRELAKSGVSVILTDVDFSSRLPEMMKTVSPQ